MRDTRFAFGANWRAFLPKLDEARTQEAERSLQIMLARDGLQGQRFLDVGCGSGLFSLAACRLGAVVYSFDYDPDSVACTETLRARVQSAEGRWTIERGSVLDASYLNGLGTFDIVYSWGVLHHTGQMWKAIENLFPLVRPGGQLFIAIYNDQGFASTMWYWIKRAYNALPPPLRFLVLWPAAGRLWGPTILRDLLTRGRPFQTWRGYAKNRGMSPWINVVDWVGGYPFEVATPDRIQRFVSNAGFRLDRSQLCGGGHGCNEFVFTRVSQA